MEVNREEKYLDKTKRFGLMLGQQTGSGSKIYSKQSFLNRFFSVSILIQFHTGYYWFPFIFYLIRPRQFYHSFPNNISSYIFLNCVQNGLKVLVVVDS